MKAATAKAATLRYYDRHADQWAAAHGADAPDTWWPEEMNRFCDLLPAGHVLEVGSGAGTDASALIARGFSYTGIDASRGLLEIAQRRNPQADFHLMDVEELHFADACFDGFWASAVLLHLPKTNLGKALDALRQVTRPGGVGFIAMKQGLGERQEDSTGRWFAYYSRDELSSSFAAHGFSVIEDKITPASKDTWLVFYVERDRAARTEG